MSDTANGRFRGGTAGRSCGWIETHNNAKFWERERLECMDLSFSDHRYDQLVLCFVLLIRRAMSCLVLLYHVFVPFPILYSCVSISRQTLVHFAVTFLFTCSKCNFRPCSVHSQSSKLPFYDGLHQFASQVDRQRPCPSRPRSPTAHVKPQAIRQRFAAAKAGTAPKAVDSYCAFSVVHITNSVVVLPLAFVDELLEGWIAIL